MPSQRVMIVDANETPVNFAQQSASAAATADAVTPGSGANVTSVAASTSAVQLLAANPARKSTSVFYDGTGVMSIYLGAASTVPVIKLGQGLATYWEPPYPGYRGVIRAQWTSTNGAASVAEYL